MASSVNEFDALALSRVLSRCGPGAGQLFRQPAVHLVIPYAAEAFRLFGRLVTQSMAANGRIDHSPNQIGAWLDWAAEDVARRGA